MNIVITGGAGFLGTLLIQHLLSEADAGKIKLDSVISFDLIPTSVTDPRVRSITGEITDKDAVSQAVTENTDTIVHLASVLSGGSELDFDSATHVNIDGTRTLLEAARSVRELEKNSCTSLHLHEFARCFRRRASSNNAGILGHTARLNLRCDQGHLRDPGQRIQP